MVEVYRSIEILGALSAMGIAISIDDFGTGYSSLAYLKRFPISALKIDRTFVRGIPHDAEDTAIVRAMIVLAHSLELTVVAEGVEELSQLAYLRAEGCDGLQGYLVSRPVPAGEMMRFLECTESLLGTAGIAHAGSAC